MKKKIERIIISGGGTGGHIFPAIAIADAVKMNNPKAEILFIGAAQRMEMEKVPQAGYNIVGLNIQGLKRSKPWKNFRILFHHLLALQKAKSIIKKFRPDIVVGVGGYASAPTLLAAQRLKIPTLIQEQNGFAGKANKILGKKAKAICVAYPNMERFFPKAQVFLTGNPIRAIIEKQSLPSREEALEFFHLEKSQFPILVIIGGSLGAKTINESIASGISNILKKGYQVIWQTGQSFYPKALDLCNNLSKEEQKQICILPFIEKMEMAYTLSDLLISRAGASSISEISFLGIPSLLIPYPFAAEDHQMHNAKALASRSAALLIPDNEAREKLVPQAIELINDAEKLNEISQQVKTLALPNAAYNIVRIISQIINHQNLNIDEEL